MKVCFDLVFWRSQKVMEVYFSGKKEEEEEEEEEKSLKVLLVVVELGATLNGGGVLVAGLVQRVR